MEMVLLTVPKGSPSSKSAFSKGRLVCPHLNDDTVALNPGCVSS